VELMYFKSKKDIAEILDKFKSFVTVENGEGTVQDVIDAIEKLQADQETLQDVINDIIGELGGGEGETLAGLHTELDGIKANQTNGEQEVKQVGSIVEYETVTIANTESLSGAIDLEQKTLLAIIMPAAWTASNLSFQSSENGTTWNDLYSETGAETIVTADAERYITLTPADWVGVQHLKLRSGTSGDPVTQEGDRDIKLAVKEL